jgi:Chlorophyllase enzyme
VKNLGLVLSIVGLVWTGCSGGDSTNLIPTGTTGSGSASTSTGGAGGNGSGGSETGGGGTSSSGSTSSGTPMNVVDPNANGPYAILELADAQFVNSSTGNKVPMQAFYPSGGPTPGPYPVVVVGHGFQLPASQYTNYIKRLATFGYVAITADFPTSFFGMDNNKNAKDLIAAIEWAGSKPQLQADTANVGMTGHSLGGKLALLAATLDSRVKAAIVLDPVDGGGGPGGGCNPPTCVDVSALMPNLKIPTGFLGEITDASGGFQSCAPAAENYTTFFKGTNTPSLSVTVKGANHMSFLDDVASCGATCGFCNMAMVDNDTVNALSRAYVTAFYERYLRGNTGYDTYLNGAEAQARYVDTNLVAIESK